MNDPDARLAMDVFSIASWSYAPSNLRHLWPPVPNDLPPQHDATIFTFEDAFEDLLAVSQGGPLPDINTRYSQRKLLQQMYPDGEPMWFWLRRLQSQGLIKESRGMGHRLLDTDDFGSFGRQILDQAFSRLQWPDWESSQDPFGRRAPKVRRPDSGADDEPTVADFFDELHRGIHGAFHGPRHNDFPKSPSSKPDDDELLRDDHRRQRGLLPDTFDDLFSAITSGFAEGHKTWDTFVKTISDRKQLPASASEEKELQETRQDLRQDRHEENREVVTRDEHVDRFGYLHTTVTRKTYDEDGNEIGSSTHFTMRLAEPSEKNAPESTELQTRPDPDAQVIDRTEQESQDQQKQQKKQGWFWK